MGNTTIVIEKRLDFAQQIITWQKRFGRHHFPWSRSGWGYGVWISEIMLQQTQTDVVLPKFLLFIEKFPTLAQLAESSLSDVLACWSGLGYYRRAHYLHRAAQSIMQNHQGHFPKNFESLVALPGVGRSTAGAILSLAYGQQYPVLDGNVKRILMRYFGQCFSEKEAWLQAWQLLPEKGQSMMHYNQGLMDLGATVCRPKKPECHICPVRKDCRFAALSTDEQASMLLAQKACKKPQRRQIYLRAWVILTPEQLYLKPVGVTLPIWPGLFCFPLEVLSEADSVMPLIAETTVSGEAVQRASLRHQCSHLCLHASLHIFFLNAPQQIHRVPIPFSAEGTFYSYTQLAKLGLPSFVFKALQIAWEKSSGCNHWPVSFFNSLT